MRVSLLAWTTLGFGLLFFLSASPEAFAQDSELYKKEIRSLFQDGKSLAEKNEFKSAILKFLSALDLFKRLEDSTISAAEKAKLKTSKTNFFYFLARAYQLDGQQIEAFDYYLRCTKNAPKSKTAQICEKELATLRPLIPLRVQKMIAEAADGRPKDSSPPPLRTVIPPASQPVTQPFSPPRRVAAIERPIFLPPPPPPPVWPQVLGWTGAIIGILAVGGGIAMLYAANQQTIEYAKGYKTPDVENQKLIDLYGSIQGLTYGGWAAVGVAGVAGGLAIFGFVRASQPPPPPPSTPSPSTLGTSLLVP